MPPLIKDRAIASDEWVYADADNAAGAAKLVLPLADYLVAAAAGEAGASRGVLLKPEDQNLDPLDRWIPQLPLITIHFGSSGEGRGYTQGRLLRDRHGYHGELRARGAVRADQIWFLARCGFDAFDLAPGEDPDTVIAQLHRFSVAYQTGLPEQLTKPRARYGR